VKRTGTLRVVAGISRLEGWRRLARQGEDDPLGAATDFLAERGFDDGDFIQVTGELGTLNDGTPVCFISEAVSAGTLTGGLGVAAKSSAKSFGGSKANAKSTKAKKSSSTKTKAKKRNTKGRAKKSSKK